LDFNLLGYSLGYPLVFTGIFVLSWTLDLDNGFIIDIGLIKNEVD